MRKGRCPGILSRRVSRNTLSQTGVRYQYHSPGSNGPITNGETRGITPPDTASSSSRGPVRAVDTWLDGLAQERRTLEVLLREPVWENGWDRIMAGMTA